MPTLMKSHVSFRIIIKTFIIFFVHALCNNCSIVWENCIWDLFRCILRICLSNHLRTLFQGARVDLTNGAFQSRWSVF